MIPRGNHPRGEDGFTLIELLVAVTLVALMTTMLFGSLRFGTRATAAVAVRVDHTSAVAGVYDFMQSQLTDARLLQLSSDPVQAASGFDGEPDAISFMTVPPVYLAVGGFHMFHVTVEGAVRNRRMIASWEPVQRGSLAVEPTTLEPSVLLDGVASVTFDYFGVADPNRPPDWQNQWSERADLPRLIRLRILLADGWRSPDLIIAPRVVDPSRP
jgi:general secretion pathway protein J